jgi:hypothetical protein
MPWAGACPHPVYDPEVFARQPGWMQRTSNYIRSCVRSGTEFTLADLEQFKVEARLKPVVYGIPKDVTLAALKAHGAGERYTVGLSLMSVLTTTMVQEHCTALGEGHVMRSRRPLNPWRYRRTGQATV